MMNAIKNKLKSNHGDSIAEVLVGVLVTALAALVFSTMVGTSVNIINKSSDTLNEYYESISADASSSKDGNVTFKVGSNNVTINGKSSTSVKIYASDDSDDAMQYYIGGDN